MFAYYFNLLFHPFKHSTTLSEKYPFIEKNVMFFLHNNILGSSLAHWVWNIYIFDMFPEKLYVQQIEQLLSSITYVLCIFQTTKMETRSWICVVIMADIFFLKILCL